MKKLITIKQLQQELQQLKDSFDADQTKPFDFTEKKSFKYIIFYIGKEQFAWPLHNLREIIIDQTIVPIPGKCMTLSGVFNYRNRVLPVINIHYYLGASISEIKSINILMVTKGLAFEASIPVDQLISLISITEKEIKPKPLTLKGDTASFIKGEILLENQLISILNPKSFIV